ncbi:MAG TPA: formate dehydrogenase subunit alpha [Fimbriimonas sp.]
MIQISVNGQVHQVEPSRTVLDVLRSLGIEVPTLCFDPRLKPHGACRLCAVQMEDSGRIVTSCTTPVSEGMRLLTHSPEVEAHRRTNLRLIASRYPAGELTPDLELHRYLMQYGIEPSGCPDGEYKDATHPYLLVDMDKCVHCYRCVRICDEVQGQFVWKVWNRGDRVKVLPQGGTTLLESPCVSCGACADTCPSGAIRDRSFVEKGQPEEWTRTVCPYCGVGCEINVGVKEGRVVGAKPVLGAAVNKGHLCVKGRYAHAFVHSPDRVLSPLIRTGADWREVSWDDAYRFTAESLSRILAESGPGAVGVLGSARATNEENYLAQKFARLVVGSNNVDCCARVCHGPTAVALKASLGTGAATNSFNDIEITRGFLVCGSNPTENHPVVGARIKQAVLRGASLVVIDPREIELARYADVHLQIRPGTNVAVLNAIAHTIVAEHLYDESFVQERTREFQAYVDFIRDWTPERSAEICGVSADAIRQAARTYASARPAMVFHGLGTTEHTQGTEGVRCLANLALLTGNLGKPGAGENPLRGQNNVQGSAHMGCEPSHLAGYTPIEAGADLFESVWGAPIPREKGMNWMRMLDAAVEGGLRALWAIGYDVYLSNPNANRTAKGLRNLDLVVAQDLFLNETAQFAHVFLPASSTYEKDGTFMNSERRVQRVRQCIPPIGGSRPDWQIICELASAMGHGAHFAYRSPEEIWEEVQKVWKAGSGISYSRIEEQGLQWPCTSEDHQGTTILHQGQFPFGPQAPFAVVDYIPTEEKVAEEYPFLMSTGRSLYQFNAGTMTMRTGNTVLRPTDLLEINPTDAERLGIDDGDTVVVSSRHGAATLVGKVSPGIRVGELFATFHDPKRMTNRLTSGHRDRLADAGEYKVTAVRVEKV